MASNPATRRTTGASAILKGKIPTLPCSYVSLAGRDKHGIYEAYHFSQRGGLDDLISRQEGPNTVRTKALGDLRIGLGIDTIESGLLQEQEDQNGGEAEQGDGPPVLDGPVPVGRNVAREGRTGRGAKV